MIQALAGICTVNASNNMNMSATTGYTHIFGKTYLNLVSDTTPCRYTQYHTGGSDTNMSLGGSGHYSSQCSQESLSVTYTAIASTTNNATITFNNPDYKGPPMILHDFHSSDVNKLLVETCVNTITAANATITVKNTHTSNIDITFMVVVIGDIN